MTNQLELLAIKNSDMKQILSSYGLLDSFENGELFCPETDIQLKWDNLGAIKVDRDTLILYSTFANSIYYEKTGTG